MLPTLIILIFTVVIIFTVIPYAFMSVIRQMEAAQVRPVTGCRAQRNISVLHARKLYFEGK